MQLTPEQLITIKQKALLLSEREETLLILDNNRMTNAFGISSLEFCVAAGVKTELHVACGAAFEQLKLFRKQNKRKYLFGYFTYDLKNEIEQLSSKHPDHIGFPSLYFFVPEKILVVDKDLHVLEGKEFASFLLNNNSGLLSSDSHFDGTLQARVSRDEYIDTVTRIKENILNGDFYEMNYCVEFYAENSKLNPEAVYEKLKEISPNPFGAYLRLKDKYLVCASPERFLALKEKKLISQPIKGTIKRGATPTADEELKQELVNSEKEQAENLMIVDLVRNDLARSSVTGSINVEELFGIYAFKQLYQMISTVTSTIHPEMDPVDAIKNAFPMGSMTGAPKIETMKWIEQYEATRRGLYSGALGYFSPEGNFDFNVVIRSLQYNRATGYISLEVGSAITFDSNPEREYEECLLKAKAMMEVLLGK